LKPVKDDTTRQQWGDIKTKPKSKNLFKIILVSFCDERHEGKQP